MTVQHRPILCGIDFSPASLEAARAAAALAVRLGVPLQLVHAARLPALWALTPDHRRRALEAFESRLRAEAAELRRGGLDVETRLAEGAAEEVILEQAGRSPPSLIVLGAVGEQGVGLRRVGSTTERVSSRADAPLLIVPDGQAIAGWARGERSLRILLGDDLTPVSDAALRWTADLARLGRCEIVVAHVYWPPVERARLGLLGRLGEVEQETDQSNLAALKRHAGRFLRDPGVEYRVQGSLGHPAEALVAMAESAGADLLVVGTKQRKAASRFWLGSISQVALHRADSPVASVPETEPSAPELEPLPTFRRVLVTTDFSPAANRALGYAVAMTADEGVVHLLHVAEDDQDPSAEVTERLRALLPPEAVPRDIQVAVEVVVEHAVADAISFAAERHDVDAVCIASRGRSGLARIALGSVTRVLLDRCRRPVLVVPAPRSG